MVLVFARGLSDGLIGLIKQVDAAVAADPEKNTRGFVAFLDEPEDALKQRLRDLATKEKIAIPLVLPVERPPKGYPLAGEALVTVLVYEKHKVKKNFALREGELDAKAIAEIVEAARFGREGGRREAF